MRCTMKRKRDKKGKWRRDSHEKMEVDGESRPWPTTVSKRGRRNIDNEKRRQQIELPERRQFEWQ